MIKSNEIRNNCLLLEIAEVTSRAVLLKVQSLSPQDQPLLGS